jgi:hypothetical protein
MLSNFYEVNSFTPLCKLYHLITEYRFHQYTEVVSLQKGPSSNRFLMYLFLDVYASNELFMDTFYPQ